MALSVRNLSAEEHLTFIRSRPSVSFLQTPAWGAVKREWRSESIGWVNGSGDVVGAALILYRQIPRVRRYLAYLPEGPTIDWSTADLSAWLEPLVAHAKSQGAFGIRMGPPVVTRRWKAETVKAAIAAGSAKKLTDIVPDEAPRTGFSIETQLYQLGWRPVDTEGGFGAGQPKYVFQLPLAGRTQDDLLKGFNQQWRRNIKKAQKVGVHVSHGTYDDLAEFHSLYLETAKRDGFTPRPLSYFQGMWQAMAAEEPDRLCLYLAEHEGDLAAATTMVRVGTHAWYSYGASAAANRDVRGSNAVQWKMMTDALAAGCDVYDMRGITETLDESSRHFGLIRFKLGTGGEAVEYVGEWDLPISKVLYSAFDLYMKRR